MDNVIVLLDSEEWRDITGYEGLYQISNLGRVKALPKSYVICCKNVVNKTEKILRTGYARGGYKKVELNKNGTAKTCLVHRLVAEAFVPNPTNKPHIDHINTIRDDNRVENLRWVTLKENAANPITHKRKIIIGKLKPSGEKNPLFEEKSKDSKPVIQYDKSGNIIARYACCHQAGRKNNGYSFSSIARVCRG